MSPTRRNDDEHPDPLESCDDTVESLAVVPPLLSRVAAFKHLDDEVLRLLYSSMTERCFEPGDVLMKQGDAGTSLIVLGTGKVEVSVEVDAERHH